MAIEIGEAPTTKIVRFTAVDVAGETWKREISLDGAMDDADVVLMMESIEATTNCAYENPKLVLEFDITGMRSVPVAALNQFVAIFLGLYFQKTSPLNAAKTVARTFELPAYKDAIRAADNSIDYGALPATPASPEDHITRLVNLLEDNLQYVGADGEVYPGGWTVNNDKSAFGTAQSRTDGL
jgi:hypothetical protein